MLAKAKMVTESLKVMTSGAKTAAHASHDPPTVGTMRSFPTLKSLWYKAMTNKQ
jgi:hypothetical protein